MSEGKILLKRHITGQPVPPSKSMTPEEFSRYILEPISFLRNANQLKRRIRNLRMRPYAHSEG